MIGPAGNRKLDRTFEDVAELLSFVLEVALAASARVDMINETGEQVLARTRDQSFKPDAVAPAHLVRLDDRSLASAQYHIVGIVVSLEQAGDRHIEGGRHPMKHLER